MTKLPTVQAGKDAFSKIKIELLNVMPLYLINELLDFIRNPLSILPYLLQQLPVSGLVEEMKQSNIKLEKQYKNNVLLAKLQAQYKTEKQ